MPGPDHKAYKGFRGSIAAALQHHGDKFSKEACKKGSADQEAGKLCPYAIFTNMKNKGEESHYKEQPHTDKGTPKLKQKFKDEPGHANESSDVFKKWCRRNNLNY